MGFLWLSFQAEEILSTDRSIAETEEKALDKLRGDLVQKVP